MTGLLLFAASIHHWEDKMDKRKGRGFASMNPEKQRAIASKGGAALPPEKRSFATNKALASAAGRKGGKAVHVTRGRQKP